MYGILFNLYNVYLSNKADAFLFIPTAYYLLGLSVNNAMRKTNITSMTCIFILI